MIILIGGEKGGTGKTTLATHLAALRAGAGHDVLLVDTDPQASASAWCQRREAEGIRPAVLCVQKFGKGVQAALRDLHGRYGDIIVDAGGRDSIELRAALVAAGKVFIPIQPAQFDLWTLDRMEQLVGAAQGFNPDLLAFVLISRASSNRSSFEAAAALALLNDFTCLRGAVSVIRDRIAYRNSAREGRAVSELTRPDAKAVNEMQQFYEEVFSGH